MFYISETQNLDNVEERKEKPDAILERPLDVDPSRDIMKMIKRGGISSLGTLVPGESL